MTIDRRKRHVQAQAFTQFMQGRIRLLGHEAGQLFAFIGADLRLRAVATPHRFEFPAFTELLTDPTHTRPATPRRLGDPTSRPAPLIERHNPPKFAHRHRLHPWLLAADLGQLQATAAEPIAQHLTCAERAMKLGEVL